MALLPGPTAFILLAAAWIVGAALGSGLLGPTPAIDPAVERWAAALCLALVAAIHGTRPSRSVARSAAVSTYLAISIVAGAISDTASPTETVGSEGIYRLDGRVMNVVSFEDTARNDIRVVDGSEIAHGRIRLPPHTDVRLYGPPLTRGAWVRVVAHLAPRRRLRNPPFRRNRGSSAWMVGSIGRPGQVAVLTASPWSALARVRSHVRSSLRRTLSPRAAGFARTLLLGDRRALPDAERETVRAAGLAHVLAVSGLHVTLVAGLVVALIRWVTRWWTTVAARHDSRRIAYAAGVPTTIAFAMFSGGAPSAWRAAVTVSIALSLLFAGRRPKPTATWAAAVLVLALVPVADTHSVGFFLSVAATAAIITPVRNSDTNTSVRSWFASATWRALIATAPIAYHCFGSVPMAGLVSNATLVPVVALIVPIVVGHSWTATFLPPLSRVTGALLEALMDSFMNACEIFASAGLGTHLSPPSIVQSGAAVLGAGCLLASAPSRTRSIGFAAACLLWLGAELHIRFADRIGDPSLRVTFMDVGQGDAAAIRFPNGRLWLIDAGGLAPSETGHRRRDPAAEAIDSLLRAERISSLDVAIATHAHPDHIGGLLHLATTFPPAELWSTEQASTEMPFGPFARYEDHRPVVRRPKELCTKGYREGNVVTRVLWPCPTYDPGLDLNNNSIVVALEHGRHRFLFTGDIEVETERILIDRYGESLRADVLKVPHHGSATSSCAAFIHAVRPRVVVVSAGTGNRFGHPHRDVLRRYRKSGATIVRTDVEGAAEFRSDANTLEYRTALDSYRTVRLDNRLTTSPQSGTNRR